MNSEDRSRLVREVALAGNCSHPIRLRGEMVNLATGEVGENLLRVACKDRRQVVCPSCSYLYKADAWILVASGLVGGHKTPASVTTHPRLFVTLTAPSFGPVHTITRSGACVSEGRYRGPMVHEFTGDHLGESSRSDGATTCRHGANLDCADRHSEVDPRLGKPLCAECFDYEATVLWNAHASRLWSRTALELRRSLAAVVGVRQEKLKDVAQVQYLKVAEIQRRGSVHFHAVIRADGPGGIGDTPPAELTSVELAQSFRHVVGKVSIDGLDGSLVKWGRILDVQDLSLGHGEPTKVASYVAKYSVKTTDGSRDLARRFNLRRQIEIMVDDPHIRRLALTAWDLGGLAQYFALNLRHHANAFGYTGHLITKSRGYSTTFAALRETRAQFMAGHNVGDPIEGTFHFEGRGYEDPRGAAVAEIFFQMRRELRQEAAQARRDAHMTSEFTSPESTSSSEPSENTASKSSVSNDCELT